MEHESDGDTSTNWLTRYSHQRIDKGTGGLGEKTRKKVETIQTTALLRSARILRRVLETWGDLLSLKLQWETISKRWCEKFVRGDLLPLWKDVVGENYSKGYNYFVGIKLFLNSGIFIFLVREFSSSSSSCRAASADIPDPLSPFLPIIHRLRQVFRVTSCVLT